MTATLRGQTAIPVVENVTQVGPCLWCGSPGDVLIEVEKGRFRMHGGVKVLAKAPVTAPACDRCSVRLCKHAEEAESVSGR